MKKLSPQDKALNKVLKCLNTAVKADKGAMYTLLCNIAPCKGKGLLNHPHVVIGRGCSRGQYSVGMMGVINGVLTSIGLPRICYTMKTSKIEISEGQIVGSFFDGFAKAPECNQPGYKPSKIKSTNSSKKGKK